MIEFGCGYGYVVKHLTQMGVDVYGVDKDPYPLINSVAPKRVMSFLQPRKIDFVVSWNLLDAVQDESTAKKLVDILGKASQSYHVLCTDLEDNQSDRYSEEGFFIRPIGWWLDIFDSHVVVVDFHTGKVYNRKRSLKIPLCWGRISE